MKRKLLLLCFLTVFLAGCQNNPYNPEELDHLCVSRGSLYCQDENRNIYCVDLQSCKTVKPDVPDDSSIYQMENEIYLVGGGHISKLTNGSFAEVGTAPDSSLAELVGIVDEHCYYVEWEKIVSWNYITSEKTVVYSFSDVVTFPIAVTKEGLFYGDDVGLHFIGFGSDETVKVAEGYVSALQADRDVIYYAVSSQREASVGENGETDTYYSGATYYRYDHGVVTALTETNYGGTSKTRFAIDEGCLYAVDESDNRERSVLCCVNSDGSVSRKELSQKVDVEKGIAAEGNIVVFGGPEHKLWKYDKESDTISEVQVSR